MFVWGRALVWGALVWGRALLPVQAERNSAALPASNSYSNKYGAKPECPRREIHPLDNATPNEPSYPARTCARRGYRPMIFSTNPCKRCPICESRQNINGHSPGTTLMLWARQYSTALSLTAP